MKTFPFLLRLGLLFMSTSAAHAQNFQGSVRDSLDRPLPSARVVWLLSQGGIGGGHYTDSLGRFSFALKSQPESVRAIVSAPNYFADTVLLQSGIPYPVRLQAITLNAYELVVESFSTSLYTAKPQFIENIGSRELRRAACCNLSESFETNATVDVGYTDAVTGAKTIQLLGLDGRYVSITSEQMPSIRGLASAYGIGYIPGPWMESIQISKGSGSAANGFESMAGQINVELKKPETADRFYLNAFLNHLGRFEMTLQHAERLNPRWSVLTLAQGDYFETITDRNADGFLDIPFKKSVSGMHRWKFQGKRMEAQFGAKVLAEDRKGGTLSAFQKPSLGPIFLAAASTLRAEAFGKTGFFFAGKPYQSLGLMFSGTFHDQRGPIAGRNYLGQEYTGYFNLVFQSRIRNDNHSFKTGASMLYDQVEEGLDTQVFARTEAVPGVFLEYTWKPLSSLQLVTGGRLDAHNLFGLIPQPRFHLRWEPQCGYIFRLSGSRGFRSPNPFADRMGMLMTGREITVDIPEWKPELTWTYGGGFQWVRTLFGRDAQVTLDFFETRFERQFVADREQSGQLRMYYVEGSGFSRVAQANVSFFPLERFELRLGWKWQDVQAEFQGQLQAMPLMPMHRGVFTAGYNWKKAGFTVDATVQLMGPGRYPEVDDPGLTENRPLETPWFGIVLLQMTKSIGPVELYAGVENLLDYRQENPLVDAGNPNGDNFDASLVFAPIFGRTFYAGVHWSPFKK